MSCIPFIHEPAPVPETGRSLRRSLFLLRLSRGRRAA